MFQIERYLDDYVALLSQIDARAIDTLSLVLFEAWRHHRTVFCCGNGGSAANACHFVADLTKLTAPVRGRRLRAMALTESLAAISAIGNDISYDEIFAEQLRAFIEPGDVVVGLSTSGSSPNVLRAVEYANSVRATTIGVTGLQGERLSGLARYALVLPSTSVQHIEDATMMVGHLLCLRTKELIGQEALQVALTKKAPIRQSLRPAKRAAAG